MCGICGVASLVKALDADGARLRVHAMVEALAHRGPDESGQTRSGAAVLGATRLAIRGLDSGTQPIADTASGVVIVCNGEIDNHRALREWLKQRGRIVTQATDIAVIPGLYLELGDVFVERLAGAFAIAVWDPQKQRLLLARDRAGERPLFFTIRDGLVHFATEIAALASETHQPLSLAQQALAGYLQFGIFVAPDTPFAEIQKVGPGEIVTITAHHVQRKRYWCWNIAATPKRAPSLEAFDEIFRAAVRRQSDVDVEFGVFLSGGIDSSLIAAVLKNLRPHRPLRAYTLRFDEQSYDEGSFAERVARELGLECAPVWVRPEVFPEEIGELIRLVGEPLADPAWIPTALLARRAAQDARMALVGEGGDELFGGYPTYVAAQAGDWYTRLPHPLRAMIKRAVECWPPSEKKVTLSFMLKRFVAGADLVGIERHRVWTSNITPSLLHRLGVAPPPPVERPAVTAMLDAMQWFDLETSLAEGLLTKADRASMSAAFELRAPFLDQAVMEFAATLPAAQRVRGLTTKVFLKRYAERYLPASIIHRKKRGLSVPLSSWLRGPLREWAEAQLSAGPLAEAGVNPRAARELLEEHCLRRADHARALWTLMVLSEWLAWASKRRA